MSIIVKRPFDMSSAKIPIYHKTAKPFEKRENYDMSVGSYH